MTEQWEAKQDPSDPVDGPWEVGFTNSRGLYVLLGYGLTEDTARLIAAGPELLQALIDLHAHCVAEDQYMRAAEFVIRKATEPRP